MSDLDEDEVMDMGDETVETETQSSQSEKTKKKKPPRQNPGAARKRPASLAATSLPPSTGYSALYATGFDTPLINVKLFRQEWNRRLGREHEYIQNHASILDRIPQEQIDNLLNVDDLIFPTVFDTINRALKAETERTRESDSLFNGTPPEIKGTINFDAIPTTESIEEERKTNLESLNRPNAKILNGNMIPKKESNFITPAMEQTFVELPRDPVTGNPLKQPIRSDEVVLKVAIFHQEKSVKTQEFIVLASQKLSQLRDVLYCLSDHVPNGRDIKSGYFFIENEFYIDRRDRNNIDYSSEVIKFVNDPKNNKKGISGVHNSLVPIPKEAKIMEETSFNDLQLRLNYRYLYCHQGNCMHYLVFTEMRLIHNGDNDNALWYPIRTFQGKVNRKKCQICDLYSACWVTFRDKLTPEDPSFFCDTCFRQLHYTSDGYLVQENRDFSVFRYHHD